MDKKSPSRMSESQYDKQIALVLQGGGALGSYQAGVYEAMAEYGYQPHWVAGISIGAINSAIIAGNAPRDRVARLREFWDQVSSPSASWPDLPHDGWRDTMRR
jgi:NTE family protein